MKKVIIAMIAAAMLISSFTACTNDTPSDENETQTNPTASENTPVVTPSQISANVLKDGYKPITFSPYYEVNLKNYTENILTDKEITITLIDREILESYNDRYTTVFYSGGQRSVTFRSLYRVPENFILDADFYNKHNAVLKTNQYKYEYADAGTTASGYKYVMYKCDEYQSLYDSYRFFIRISDEFIFNIDYIFHQNLDVNAIINAVNSLSADIKDTGKPDSLNNIDVSSLPQDTKRWRFDIGNIYEIDDHDKKSNKLDAFNINKFHIAIDVPDYMNLEAYSYDHLPDLTKISIYKVKSDFIMDKNIFYTTRIIYDALRYR